MKLQPTKAGGCFALPNYGSLELIIHIEADPRALSCAPFDFHTILPARKADAFRHMSAYLLRHEAGVFVIAVKNHDFASTRHLRDAWCEADRILAGRNIWLFSTTSEALQAEPHWSNAQQVARCARSEVHPHDEARVIDFLEGAGQAPLIECARRCEASSDSCDAALKLVSNGTLHFDASTPLTLNSPVRLGSFSPCAPIAWLSSNDAQTASGAIREQW
ncbi:hypothetical protein [Bosea sp. ASV33]|uniref:hypothetical protein n=1 Tax=Bosea sp. ASV33 TaxID=2795106 RepID=UPI0018EC7464|nr:hypothetical protein [Bosea sp. ASV33]